MSLPEERHPGSEREKEKEARDRSIRENMARKLVAMVSLAGVLPIVLLGVVALQVLRSQSKTSAQAQLEAVARQASERIRAYMIGQREALRAVAAAGAEADDSAFRLEEVVLDAPSLGRVALIGPDNPEGQRPPMLNEHDVVVAQNGSEVSSEIYITKDLTPAIDTCIPARSRPGHAVCAQLDMLELWRFVQHIRVGETGYALALDGKGRLLASGIGPLRAAILSGEPVLESPVAFISAVIGDSAVAPKTYIGPEREEVLAGWSLLKEQGWSVVVEQPVEEALRAARIAQHALLVLSVIGLVLSIGFGLIYSRRMLGALEIMERWNTAGRIAAGITHDLGHRVAILQQTAGLAESGDPSFLPRIRDNLKSEVATLRKFVSDFADLSREVKSLDLYATEVNSFVQSVCRTAQAHADRYEIRLVAVNAPVDLWVKADRYLLERATMNLVSNAIDASARGTEVALRVEYASDRVILAVVDKGQGIEPDRLDRIFDAFKSTKRTGAHVGMGLPNVKRIVEAHGGRVAVESVLGQGTTFRIVLPSIPPPGAQLPRQPSASSAGDLNSEKR